MVTLFFACEKTRTIQAFPDRFAGVGIELEKEGQYAKVIRVIPASPAEEVGIRVNDLIIAVDNVNIANLSLAEVVDRIRGIPKTTVILTIESSKDKTINVLAVKRRRSILTEQGYIFEE
ncbi:MAG: PDZ domain-containing protein [Deltaproteobacteria bacterium]|nr:PDZ domain-containing protein [Deltaproteobacteria bacterium]